MVQKGWCSLIKVSRSAGDIALHAERSLLGGEGVLSAEPAVASSFGAADLLELVRVRLCSFLDAVILGTLTPPLARVNPRTSGGLCTERQTRKTVSAWEHYTTHKCGRARTANSMGFH